MVDFGWFGIPRGKTGGKVDTGWLMTGGNTVALISAMSVWNSATNSCFENGRASVGEPYMASERFPTLS